MAENKLKIQHLRSKELVDGKPKLPTELDEGEIAINFANGHETIAIKNDRNQIVKFDNKVDENYEPTQYNGKFETLITETNHVKAGDTNSKAFKSVENTMSTLVDEVYKNEKAIVTTFGTVGSATGIVDAEGNISYQTKADAHYIAPATSVHKATVLLDNSLNRVETTVNEHQNQITAVKATADQNKTDIGGLASSIGIEKETEGTYSYPNNIGSNYFEGATSVIRAMTDLDNEIYNVNGKVRKIATATGVINAQDVIGYQKETANYIGDATSVHDATVKLDIRLKQTTDTSNKNFQNIEYLANVAGAVKNVEGTYIYQSNDNTKYIAGAHSVHEATVLLDSSLNRVETTVNEHQNQITAVKATADQNKTDITAINGDILAFSGRVMNIATAAGVINNGTIGYQKETGANYIAGATSVHDATVKLDTALKQVCPISLDFVELNGIKWLTFDFNDFIGHTYQWGSLGDETKSPFPSFNIDSDTNEPQENPAWTAIKNIVAPLSSNKADEASVERTRLLSPSFDIIYHLTHGHARMARELEYKSLNQNNIQQTRRVEIGPVASTKWDFSYKENPNNFITLHAGLYKPAEIGAMVTVRDTDNIGQENGAILNNSSFSYEGRIMGVLIK